MDMAKWVGGFAEWTDGDTAYLSVAFTWLLDKAFSRALWYRALGYRVRAGGPALFLVRMKHELADVAELGGDAPDAIARHNWPTLFALAAAARRRTYNDMAISLLTAESAALPALFAPLRLDHVALAPLEASLAMLPARAVADAGEAVFPMPDGSAR